MKLVSLLLLFANCYSPVSSELASQLIARLAGVSESKLLAFYPFNPNTNYNDVIGNAPAAIPSGGPITLAPGPNSSVNASVETDGASSYINFTSPLFDFGYTSWTISLWVQVADSTKNGPIIQYYTPTPPTPIFYLWQRDGYLDVNYQNINDWMGSISCPLSSGAVISVAYNGSSNVMTIYCNSEAADSATVTSPSFSITTPTLLAGYNPYGPDSLQCQYACLGFYTDILTPQQAMDLVSTCVLLDLGTACSNCGSCAWDGVNSYICVSCNNSYLVGPQCDIVCSPYCTNGSCSVNGNSTSGYSCSSCINSNFLDDQCSAGNCKVGFSGDDCSKVESVENSKVKSDGDIDVKVSNNNANSDENKIKVA